MAVNVSTILVPTCQGRVTVRVTVKVMVTGDVEVTKALGLRYGKRPAV